MVSTSFSPQKAVAALMYIVSKATDNMYNALKMLYVADKRHLNDTGRYMFGETYVAMKKGATPSGVYDIVKYVRGDGDNHYNFTNAKNLFSVNNDKIVLKQDVPTDHISEAAKTYLDGVVKENQGASIFHWYRAAHDSAWKSVWFQGVLSGSRDITPQDIAEKSLQNDSLLQYLND